MSRNVAVLSVVALIGSGLIAGSVAYANGASITACVKKSNGATRIISGKMKCAKSERQISWGQTGTTGATGATGATGPQGPAGRDGITTLYYKGGDRLESQLEFDSTETTQLVLSAEIPAGLHKISFSGQFAYQAIVEDPNGQPNPNYSTFPLAIGCVLTTGLTYSPGQTSDILLPTVRDPNNFFPYMIQINPSYVGNAGVNNTSNYSDMDILNFSAPILFEYRTTVNLVCTVVNPKASEIFAPPGYTEYVHVHNPQFMAEKVNELDSL